MPSAWFYASKDHGRLNGKPFFPEAACGRLMANPLYQNLLDFSDLSQDPNSKVGNQLAEFRRIYKKQPSWSIAEICETMKIPPRARPILPGTLGSPWRQAFSKEQKKAPGGYHPADLAIENIRRYATWMESLGLGQPPHDDRLERITEGMEKLELFFASFGPDRRRRAAFSPASAARFVDQEVRRRQLSMWD